MTQRAGTHHADATITFVADVQRIPDAHDCPGWLDVAGITLDRVCIADLDLTYEEVKALPPRLLAHLKSLGDEVEQWD